MIRLPAFILVGCVVCAGLIPIEFGSVSSRRQTGALAVRRNSAARRRKQPSACTATLAACDRKGFEAWAEAVADEKAPSRDAPSVVTASMLNGPPARISSSLKRPQNADA